jgi:hypothetical protein
MNGAPVLNHPHRGWPCHNPLDSVMGTNNWGIKLAIPPNKLHPATQVLNARYQVGWDHETGGRA